jgi:two-component system nitrate/nitrite response regulator NarL
MIPTIRRNKAIGCLIADDHPIFRRGLRNLLEAQQAFRVVAEAADGVEAVTLAKQLKPDLVLLDLAMPRYSGLEALRDLISLPAAPRVIVLATANENSQIVEALELGAQAVVLKEWSPEMLIQSINTVNAGQYWMGHETVAGLLQALRDRRSDRELNRTRNFGLTPRQLEIVEMIAAGHTNRAIAEDFRISDQTVKHHLTSIFSKLGVSTRLELALFAVNHSIAALDMEQQGIHHVPILLRGQPTRADQSGVTTGPPRLNSTSISSPR